MIKLRSRCQTFTLLCIVLMSLLLVMPTLVDAAEVVNVNRADAATMIANWKGIGEKKARAIISYRKKNGPFKSIDDLKKVDGIGEGLIKKNKRYMSLNSGAKTTTAGTTKKKTTSNSTSKKKKSTKKESTSSTKSKSSNKKKSAGKKKSTDKKTSKKPSST